MTKEKKKPFFLWKISESSSYLSHLGRSEEYKGGGEVEGIVCDEKGKQSNSKQTWYRNLLLYRRLLCFYNPSSGP